jgi:proline iminopeptidase
VEPSEGHVKVLGFKIYYCSFGRPEKGTVLALAGGPFGTHDIVLPMADLVQFGYRVVMYDYLGCGRSDRPKGAKYYTQDRAVDEVEGVRRALKLGRVHLLGVSYGGILALDVALRRPKSLRSLVVSSAFASKSLGDSEWDRMFSYLPRGIRNTITRYEDKGDVKNPKYLAALDVWNRRHICRLRVWPYDAWYSLERYSNDNIGDNLPARLEGWDVTDRLPEIRLPCLITVGEYDARTPKCARAIHRGIGGSKLVVFGKCSHAALWEDRVRFIEVVRDFLDGVTSRK